MKISFHECLIICLSLFLCISLPLSLSPSFFFPLPFFSLLSPRNSFAFSLFLFETFIFSPPPLPIFHFLSLSLSLSLSLFLFLFLSLSLSLSLSVSLEKPVNVVNKCFFLGKHIKELYKTYPYRNNHRIPVCKII